MLIRVYHNIYWVCYNVSKAFGNSIGFSSKMFDLPPGLYTSLGTPCVVIFLMKIFPQDNFQIRKPKYLNYFVYLCAYTRVPKEYSTKNNNPVGTSFVKGKKENTQIDTTAETTIICQEIW
jgi:hypothetical protein